MRSYITLYVPASRNSVKILASMAMARVAGGCTITEHEGVWINADDRPMREKMLTLKSFVEDADLMNLYQVVGKWACDLLATGEQSVMLEINGEATFIDKLEL